MCIIGAGPSGLAVAKVLHQRGVPFQCYERSDRVGGLWAFDERDKTACYRSLQTNTSRTRTAFSDFPMPLDYPDYPGHWLMRSYFESYVEHFGFGQSVLFHTEVKHASARDGMWEVTTAGGAQRQYSALIVANGHHWQPRWPEPRFPGRFDGVEIHSHDYVDATPFVGKRVVVVGMGNSAMDIAVELSSVASRVFLSARRGAHIVPKYAFGRPIDTLDSGLPIPWPLKRALFAAIVRTSIGRAQDHGFPKPDHKLGQAHPTVSSELLRRAAGGVITPRANIAELLGDAVRFSDGTVDKVDAIIYCTGYRLSFPFFDAGLVAALQEQLPLYQRIFHPGMPGLALVGLVQAFGPLPPVAEAQACLVADYLQRRYLLPGRDQMVQSIERERKRMSRRFVKTARHSLEIDFFPYLRQLQRERRQGARRARRAKVPSVTPAGDLDRQKAQLL